MSGMTVEAQAFEQEKAERILGIGRKAGIWTVTVTEHETGEMFQLGFVSEEAATEWADDYIMALDTSEARETEFRIAKSQ